jgi:DNA polymerase elongation subunit (family B)
MEESAEGVYYTEIVFPKVLSSRVCMDQGIETVRRDNCLLVRNIVTTVLEMILIQRDDKGAKEYVRRTISDLLMNRLDLSLLVITKVPPPNPHTPNLASPKPHTSLESESEF